MSNRLLVPLLALTGALACAPSFTGPFKLAALNTTLPNVNNTGIPLLVADVQSDHNGRSYQLATVASYPYSDIVPELTLANNTLIANGPSDYASGYSLTSGSPVYFSEAIPSAPHVIANPLYCAMPPINPGGHYRLVAKANAPTSLFKLCPASWITAVVYDAQTDSTSWGYKLSDCADVDLVMIPI